MDILSARLRNALYLRGKTQADLSKLTGISDSKISCYCTGRYRPNGESLTKIARALNVSSEWLLGKTEDYSVQVLPAVQEGPTYNGEPVFPLSTISKQEEALLLKWRKAGQKEKQIVALTLGLDI